MGERIRIAVDGMGGDFAPAEIVGGAVQAARDLDVEIFMVGPKADIEAELRLVKEGKADAMVSAGATGAVMVCTLQYIGALTGIERPVLGGPFLGLSPNTVLLDLGANVGCQPYQMVNFAVAGSVYVRSFLGIENPTIGLLNVGSEEGKGTDFTKEAFDLLKQSRLNFIGNVEGFDIITGRANVIVCDGFVGNILLKFCEGLGRAIKRYLDEGMKERLASDELEKMTGRLYRLMSPATVMGGGPLWGVDGVAAVAHGASRAPQIAGTVKQAKTAVESGFIDTLRAELEKVQKTLSG
jgi:glycerol-3-phosphate acyltransferase PlsX